MRSLLKSFGNAWRNLSLALKGMIVILLPLSVLLASIGFLYHSEQQLSKLENELKISLENQRDIQAVHTQLLESSTSVRDFLLTGDKQFLNNFDRVETTLPAMLSKLESELETKAQQARLRHIQQLVMQNLRNLRALAQNDTEEASDYLIGQFKAQVSSLNALEVEIETLNIKEAELVNLDQQRIALARKRNFNITLFAVLAGILGSLLAVWVFSGTIVKRVRLLRDSARHLAKAEPLNLPSSSRDELGQLSNELDHASQLLADNIQQTKQAQLEAERANQSKSMFLSRTSHELRTPLNAILGFAQLLQSELAQGESQQKATQIKQAGDHLLKLIDEVLDIAKIESGKENFALQPVEINTLLHEAIAYIASLGRIRDIEIEHNIAPHLIGLADRQKLLQVVLNILSNALKYGPVDSIVSVRAFQRAKHIIIEVFDEGTGIPEDLKSRVFTPFDRLGAEQSKIEGSGLGLALSKQIMLAMQGDIEIDKHQSLFSIVLRSAESRAAITRQPEPPTFETPHATPATSIKNQHRILYVEDNLSNRTLVETILRRHVGLQLTCANNIKEAQHFLQHLPLDLVVIDLNLPDGSGETLVAEIQGGRYGEAMPIMILSANAVPETIQRLKQMGVACYLTKPLDIAEFTQQVNQLIQGNNHE